MISSYSYTNTQTWLHDIYLQQATCIKGMSVIIYSAVYLMQRLVISIIRGSDLAFCFVYFFIWTKNISFLFDIMLHACFFTNT